MPADPAAPAYCLPHAADADKHLLRWQAHVDAGRVGQRPAPDPAIRANHARIARVFGLRHPGEGVSEPDIVSLSSLC